MTNNHKTYIKIEKLLERLANENIDFGMQFFESTKNLYLKLGTNRLESLAEITDINFIKQRDNTHILNISFRLEDICLIQNYLKQ